MTRRVTIGDRDDVEVAEVWFETMNEPWSEYVTDDGLAVRVRTVVTEMFEIVGEVDAAGRPRVMVNSQTIVVLRDPKERT